MKVAEVPRLLLANAFGLPGHNTVGELLGARTRQVWPLVCVCAKESTGGVRAEGGSAV